MKKSVLFSRLFLLAASFGLFTSCTKDTDESNWSPTQALPPDITDTIPDAPNDTIPLDTSSFIWQSQIIGDNAFQGDSTTFQHMYDAVAMLHFFSCADESGRVMTLRLPSLEPGAYTISFDNSVYISFADNNGVLFDTSFNPNGSLVITQNSNNKISAEFDSDLNDNGITGQVKSLVNGMLANVPYQ